MWYFSPFVLSLQRRNKKLLHREEKKNKSTDVSSFDKMSILLTLFLSTYNNLVSIESNFPSINCIQWIQVTTFGLKTFLTVHSLINWMWMISWLRKLVFSCLLLLCIDFLSRGRMRRTKNIPKRSLISLIVASKKPTFSSVSRDC